MKKAVPNLLCVLGLAMISYALWQVHPAAMFGSVGALFTAGGVATYRAQAAQTKGATK